MLLLLPNTVNGNGFQNAGEFTGQSHFCQE
jgi:hypothetical protein